MLTGRLLVKAVCLIAKKVKFSVNRKAFDQGSTLNSKKLNLVLIGRLLIKAVHLIAKKG